VSSGDAIGDLRAEFAQEMRLRVDGLAAAMAGGDGVEVLERAHTLKGSAAALGLPALMAAMEQIEAALRTQPVEAEAAERALAEARRVVDALPAPDGDVARLAHALRTPLNVVLGYGHLLRDAGLGAAEREHADAIVRAAEEMRALLDRAAGAAAEQPGGQAAAGTSGTAEVTVLYIEDDPARARLAEEVLRRLPAVRLIVVATGSDGIALAERERPHLILLDPGLPDIPGDELLRRLRDGPAAAASVVVVTGDSRPERLQELLRAGAGECLTKPVDLGRLLALVDGARPG
jgi:CheY-like chemotaxis protein/HPt (histidine-containing phosphotransfer) domain-containing protein